MCTGVHVSFIATLFVEPGQAIWPIEDIPRLAAGAVYPIPEGEELEEIELIRVDTVDGRERYSALSDEDKGLIAKQCEALGLPPLLAFKTCIGIGPHLEAFNSASTRPVWLLGYLPPKDPHMGRRILNLTAEQEYAQRLKSAIQNGEIVQRLSNGAPIGPRARAQGAVLSRKDLETFCASLLIEVRDKDLRPVFDIPVRPESVPGALLALPLDTEVIVREAPRVGWLSSGVRKAGALIDSIHEVIERQQAGRFTMREAAQIVADEHGINAEWLLKRMTSAINSPFDGERLKAYGWDTRLARIPGEKGATCEDYIIATEFNAWLMTVADGLMLPWRSQGNGRQRATFDAIEPSVEKCPETWWSVASAYMVEKLRSGQFKTAKSLYHALEADAGSEASPFEKGVGANRGSLFVKEISQTLSLKTVQNKWRQLQDAARSTR